MVSEVLATFEKVCRGIGGFWSGDFERGMIFLWFEAVEMVVTFLQKKFVNGYFIRDVGGLCQAFFVWGRDVDK